MAASPVVNSTVAIVDPNTPSQQAVVDASGNLQVVVSGSLTANQSVNLAQVAGATVATGSGTATGAIRVELPTNGTGAVTINTQGYTSPATITRPANTTAYTANDVLGGAITFSSAAPSAGADLIVTSVELEADITAIPAGMTTFNLYLYSVTPPSAIADNAAFDLPSGDRASFLGKIIIGAPVDEGSTLYVRADNVNAHLKSASGSLFGYLVTVGGFTPAANSEVYKITLHGVAP